MAVLSFYSFYCFYHTVISTSIGSLMVLNWHCPLTDYHGSGITASLFSRKSKLLLAYEQLAGGLFIVLGFYCLTMLTIPADLVAVRRVLIFAGMFTHLVILVWRFEVESKLGELKIKWENQAVGDVVHILGWLVALFLNYPEKKTADVKKDKKSQ